MQTVTNQIQRVYTICKGAYSKSKIICDYDVFEIMIQYFSTAAWQSWIDCGYDVRTEV
jgi:hypothetical protein